jgi:hypothetical protein
LQWASYYDAADQVGLSRIWGGIHPPADDIPGRRVGSQVGKTAWELAKKLFDGTVLETPINLTARKLDGNNLELRFNAVRGLYYNILSSESVDGPFDANGVTAQVATEASIASTNSLSSPRKFFRVSGSLVP